VIHSDQDTGEFLTPDAAWAELQTKCVTLAGEVRNLRTGVESLAIRHHTRSHAKTTPWRECPFTTCREAAAILDSA
jgi:hypothetical protein